MRVCVRRREYVCEWARARVCVYVCVCVCVRARASVSVCVRARVPVCYCKNVYAIFRKNFVSVKTWRDRQEGSNPLQYAVCVGATDRQTSRQTGM